jgi:hypothetical protein
LIIEICTTFQSACHKEAAVLDSAGVTRVKNTHRQDVVHQNRLNVTHVSAAIASISFVIIVSLVLEFRNELSAVLRLADMMYALRTVVCQETEGLPWRSGYMGHYSAFWIAWSDWTKRASCPGSGNNVPVLMDDQAVAFINLRRW